MDKPLSCGKNFTIQKPLLQRDFIYALKRKKKKEPL